MTGRAAGRSQLILIRLILAVLCLASNAVGSVAREIRNRDCPGRLRVRRMVNSPSRGRKGIDPLAFTANDASTRAGHSGISTAIFQ